MNATLAISSFPGVTPESLGNYLMGPGLLRAVTARWPKTRGFWREGFFHLVGDFSTDELTAYLRQEWQPTPYVKWWSAAQKSDTKAQLSISLPVGRAERSVVEVRVADATIVGMTRNQFSPLFGTGGNIGKRNLAEAWREAERLRGDLEAASWLESALFAHQAEQVPPFTNAGTWFVYNNKAFNSGLGWSREGALSPWAFLLAMEGALLFVGGSGRRLGSRARPYAVFPFVSQPLQPEAREEVGQVRGEFWAPLWEQPATLGEVRALFARGLARLGGRAASAPHEFAVAAMARGADAGISAFARFELRQTTSSQVYEAIPRDIYSVGAVSTTEPRPDPAAPLLQQILGSRWLDRLPLEPFTRQSKTRFSGLRGPIERAILAISSAPSDSTRWQELLLRLAATQMRVDRNLTNRKACAAVPLLQGGWVRRAFPNDELTPELRRAVRLAGALAALGAGYEERKSGRTFAYPSAANVFGVSFAPFGPVFAQPGRPQRAVWHEGEPLAALLEFTGRRLTDSSEKLCNFRSPIGLLPDDISDFLNPDRTGNLADVARWLPPLSLVKWQRKAALPTSEPPAAHRAPSVELLQWAFFKPFFQPGGFNYLAKPGRKASLIGPAVAAVLHPFFGQNQEPRPGFARQLFALLRAGSVAAAIDLAAAGYRAQGHAVIVPPDPGLAPEEARRLAAALALPIFPNSLGRLVGRWIEPARLNHD